MSSLVRAQTSRLFQPRDQSASTAIPRPLPPSYTRNDKCISRSTARLPFTLPQKSLALSRPVCFGKAKGKLLLPTCRAPHHFGEGPPAGSQGWGWNCVSYQPPGACARPPARVRRGNRAIGGLIVSLNTGCFIMRSPPSFHGVMWHAQYDARKPWQSTFTNLKPMSWGNVFCGMERAGEHWEYAKNTARGNSSGVCAGCVWAR